MPAKKPTSAAKIRANRANAQKSTGPKTAAGKARSSRNALKHGILSELLVIAPSSGKETRRRYNTLLRRLHEHFNPQDIVEETVVERIAICYWRLRRAIHAESEATRAQDDWPKRRLTLPPQSNMDAILRYEKAIEAQLDHAFRQLERLQSRRAD